MIQSIKEKLFSDKTKLFYKVDLHSHFLPQIDDGCANIEESITLVKKMKKLGYKKLIVTPHIMMKKYPNNDEIIRKSLFELRAYLKVHNINIEVEAAAEYYCDDHFLNLIRSNKLLKFGKQYILFELPYTTRPKILEEVVKKLLALKYKPVLAHPERYRFLNSVLEYRDLKKQGLLFQVNANSFGGYYGHEAKKKAFMLSQKKMIDFLGSDIHHEKHMDCFERTILSNTLETVIRNNKILNDNI